MNSTGVKEIKVLNYAGQLDNNPDTMSQCSIGEYPQQEIGEKEAQVATVRSEMRDVTIYSPL